MEQSDVGAARAAGTPSNLGRPRSEPARRAVLDAAMRLVGQSGYSAVTIKAIAEEAGVGRQTVYRWWTSKAEILLEATVEQARALATPERTGDPGADLRAVLSSSFLLTRSAGPVISGMMADSTHDPVFAAELQSRLLAVRRDLVRGILEQGQRDGRYGTATDAALVTDMIWGTMWYRVLSKHAPVDQQLADELSTAAERMLGEP
jgi:AcrR family transcriptional regulator